MLRMSNKLFVTLSPLLFLNQGGTKWSRHRFLAGHKPIDTSDIAVNKNDSACTGI